MPTLPYRTILRLPADADAVRIAEQESEAWLLSKAEDTARELIRSGRIFEQGIHQISPDAEVTVIRADRSEDGSRRIRIQLIERGQWEASITAVDYPAGNRRRDALVVTAANIADPRGDWVAAPPRLVGDLLAREEIADGATHVTAEPKYVGQDEIDMLVTAITDRTRSVSVIVAGSLGTQADDAFRNRLKQLTSKVVGVAAVYLVKENALAVLNDRLGSSHAVEHGRVRTFLPLVDLTDALDGKRHRVLGPATFARALRGNRVARHLQEAFAYETRVALLDRPLPSDIRRSLDILDAAHATLRRAHRIDERTAKHLAPERHDHVLEASVPSRLSGEDPSTGESNAPNGVEIEQLSTSRAHRILESVWALASRWLNVREPVTEVTIERLEERLAREKAAAEEWFESASGLESDLQAARQQVAALRAERDDLDLDLSVADDDAARLRAKIRQLQETLKDAELYTEAYAQPKPEEGWALPPSVVELANILHAESADRHPAYARVEFTGDIDDVEEVQKRDTVGRYVGAFWEFIRALHDYAECKANGSFTGSVHMYLNSDVNGYKCSPQRHAATESDTVLSNASWRAERVRKVPTTVSPDGLVLMDAHFKPTHADTVAPRMHYFDDTAPGGTGKVYVGYIGRHLTNTKTQNS